MVTNHLLPVTGMILQVGFQPMETGQSWCLMCLIFGCDFCPRDPITLSEDDWDVQSPSQHSIWIPLPFSGGYWIPRVGDVCLKRLWKVSTRAMMDFTDFYPLKVSWEMFISWRPNKSFLWRRRKNEPTCLVFWGVCKGSMEEPEQTLANLMNDTCIPIFSHPKNPDPSKAWLFWGPGPLLYRFKPFHWRVQGFLGQLIDVENPYEW